MKIPSSDVLQILHEIDSRFSPKIRPYSVVLVTLSNSNQILSSDIIYTGKLEHQLSVKKLILNIALRHQAEQLLVVQYRSEPIKHLTPIDIAFAQSLKEICGCVDINVLDFIIRERRC